MDKNFKDVLDIFLKGATEKELKELEVYDKIEFVDANKLIKEQHNKIRKFMITTYLPENEKSNKVPDKELNELLQEVREKFDNKYFVIASEYETKHLFKKPTKHIYYTVYANLGNGEAQVINFCQESDWSINTSVPKSYVMTFFFGLLNGLNYAKNV